MFVGFGSLNSETEKTEICLSFHTTLKSYKHFQYKDKEISQLLIFNSFSTCCNNKYLINKLACIACRKTNNLATKIFFFFS